MTKKQVIVIYESENYQNSDGRLTGHVLIICIAVASAGLMFGYDIGINGGVTKMEPFLNKFFPSVLQSKQNAKVDRYCLFYSSRLTAYASSLYIAGIVSALMAGRLTTSTGRKGSLIIGGMIYLIGLSIHALAVNLGMLVLGRILIGFGVGFSNQTAPIYLSETAPTKWRGAIGTGFQIFFWTGVTTSNWIIYYVKSSLNPNIWRIALSLSAIPATLMTVFAFFIPDTPTSLIQRGKVQQALKSLNQVRGINADTEKELRNLTKYFEDMRTASETPYRMLLARKYRPHLVLTVALPSFHLLTGGSLNEMLGNIIIKSLGLTVKEALPFALVEGTFFILCMFVATYFVDRVGRRILLIEAGCQIFIGQVLLAVIMALDSDSSGSTFFSKQSAILALFLRAVIGMGIAWSWGPLTSLLICEILPVEVRSAGLGLSTAINFAFHFITNQTAYPMLCHIKYGIFLFYGVSALFMTVFVILFLPQTKRIPLESMDIIWHTHWYWQRFVDKSTFKSQAVELSESESVNSRQHS